MPRRNKSRAARRIQQRTEANRQARAAAGLATDDTPIRTRARHQTVVEGLLARDSISRQQAAAAERLELVWRQSGSLIGKLVQTYEPRHRDRRRGVAPGSVDTTYSIASRLEFEGAIEALGKWLSPVVIHAVIADLPVAAWSRDNGRPAPDGLALLRTGLDALDEYFSRPRAHRRPRRDPPAAPASAPAPARPVNGHAILARVQVDVVEQVDVLDQEVEQEVEQEVDLDQVDVVEQEVELPEPAGTLGDLLTAATLGEAAPDVLIEQALSYAERHGAFGDDLDAVVERLVAIRDARAAPPAPPPARLVL